METKKQEIIIRKYEDRDWDQIISVCHKTGYYGETAEKFFHDDYLFALIFSLYYPLYEKENCFVAQVGDEAVGYCIGTADTLSQQEGFLKHLFPEIKKHILKTTLIKHPHDIKPILQLLRAMRHSDEERESFFKDYPAHLHIDIFPEYHRMGLGRKLITTFIQHMKDKGVNGIHLGTSTKNYSAVPFYKSMGFKILHVRKAEMWSSFSDIYSLTFGMKLNHSSASI